MKQIAVAIFLLFLTSIAHSQEIKGIGEFKVGMSIDEFLELPSIKTKNLSDKNEDMVYVKGNELWRIMAGQTVNEYERIYSPDKVSFELETPIDIPTEGTLYRAKIVFYKGLMASIDIQNAIFDFKEILTERYGKPTFKDNSHWVVCQNGFGAKTNHVEGSLTSTWGRGGKIIAEFNSSSSSCGQSVFVFYTVENPLTVKIMEKVEEKMKKTAESINLKNKASGSKL